MQKPTRQDVLSLARRRAAERFDRGDWASAERDYQLLVRLDGTCADDLARLGVASMELGSLGFGAVCLNKALELDEQHLPARLHLGEALIRMGSISEGIDMVMRVWRGRRGDDRDAWCPAVKRAAAVLAIARYTAENPPASNNSSNVELTA